MIKWFLIIIMLLGLITCGNPDLVNAAAVYCAPAATGTGTGADWNNACDFDTVTPARGNTYVIAGGSYSNKTYGAALDGTTVITIRKASSLEPYRDDLIAGWSSSYETTQAVFTGTIVFNAGYYTIDGVTPSTGHWQTSGYGIKFQAWNANPSYLVWTSATVSPINNLTFRHIEFQNLGSSYDVEQTSITPRAYQTYDAWLISHCYFHNDQLFVKMNGYAPSGWIIEHNYFATNISSVSHHGVQNYILATATSPHQIRYNWYEPHTGTGSIIYYGGASSGVANNISIYGNVWHNPSANGTGNGIFGGGDSQAITWNNWKIYNNTFINGTVHVYQYSTPSGWEIRNNLFYSTTTDGMSSGTYTNNYRNSTTWGWGTCTNCITSAESQATLFPNYMSNDYHLGAGSQAINVGYILTSPYNVDADGKTIAVFDAGAHEYGSSEQLDDGTSLHHFKPGTGSTFKAGAGNAVHLP